VAYRLTPAKAEKLWEVASGTHYASVPVVVCGKYVVNGFIQIIDLATGKVLSESASKAFPGNGGYVQAMEDLVLVRLDGSHCRLEIASYRIGPDGSIIAQDAKEWGPSVGSSTTSYHHPIMYPLVDGRIYLRQYDGIYCWDLRKSSP
jgi:hypothetical protein